MFTDCSPVLQTSPLAPSPAHPSPRQPTQQQRPRPSQHPSPVPSPAHLALSERTPSGRSQKRRQQQSRTATATPARSGPHTPQPLGRIDDDFDFSAGLAAFDKKAVFADIKVRAPGFLLRSHTRTDAVPAEPRCDRSFLPPARPQPQPFPSSYAPIETAAVRVGLVSSRAVRPTARGSDPARQQKNQDRLDDAD